MFVYKILINAYIVPDILFLLTLTSTHTWTHLYLGACAQLVACMRPKLSSLLLSLFYISKNNNQLDYKFIIVPARTGWQVVRLRHARHIQCHPSLACLSSTVAGRGKCGSAPWVLSTTGSMREYLLCYERVRWYYVTEHGSI